MLHRAASNAYSWWWASHIRTKQSKWLDSNLLEMEDRVKSMLKLIEGDADSFGKRAELYFKSRPELMSFVEETYRAYRALAERYDHISGELHKANHTIATAFPDQVQYAMLEEEDENYPKAITPIDTRKIHKSTVESLMIKRKEDRSSIKKRQHRAHASQIDKDKAPEEINRLQKGILVLQTEKEFIKSSYESGIAKYWEIEKKITEMHEEVCYLQDEFSTSAVIDDDEARALMTAAALKSCEDAIVDLHEQWKKSKEQTRLESGRIRIAEEKLKVLKGEDSRCKLETTTEIADGNKEMNSTSVNMEEEFHSLKQERLELQEICEKVKDHFHMNSDTSVGEIVEKVDEIVNKFVNLELKVSSQTAQINTLSLENNELEKNLQSLEEDRMVLTNNSTDLSDRLDQAGEELNRVQILEKTVQDEETTLCADFSDACHSLNVISEKLLSHKHQEQVDNTNPFIEEPISLGNIEPQRECKEKEGAQGQDIKENSVEKIHGIQELGCNTKDHDQPEAVSQIENHSQKNHDLKQKVENNSSQVDASIQVQVQTLLGEQEGALDLQQLLSNGLEDREKFLLAEYTSVLRNYKETKKRLSEVEKKNHEYVCETAAIIRELTNANATKDKEIQSLQQCLGSPEMSSNGHAGANSAEAEDLHWGHHRLKSMIHLPTLGKENSNLPNSENPYVDVQSIAKLDTLTEVEDRASPDVDGMMLRHLDEPEFTSFIEEKFRRDIDKLLEENLEFWLKFSTSFHRIQEFQTTLKGLQDEIEKLKESKMQEGINSAVADQVVRAESAPIDRQLRALKTDLQVWLEQNALLRGELQCRFSSLCGIQEEISGALREGSESEGAQFTPYQAAKFQGEVLNMQQENNKVASELQAGLDHVRGLQAEIEKALSKLHEDFELSGFKNGQHSNFRHISTKTRIPLRSFLFGTKPKRASIFSRMNPAYQKQYRDHRPGFPRVPSVCRIALNGGGGGFILPRASGGLVVHQVW